MTTATSILLLAALFAATFSFLGWKEIHDSTLTRPAPITDPYETTWKYTDPDTGGTLNHKVVTHPLNETETDAAHALRHKGRVDAMKALYPPLP